MSNIRIDGADGKGPMMLDTETGNLKPIRQIPTIDWLLKYDEIRFTRDTDGLTIATYANIKILEGDKEYEAMGKGNSANAAVKELAEDIKNEHIINKGIRYYVDERLNLCEEGTDK